MHAAGRGFPPYGGKSGDSMFTVSAIAMGLHSAFYSLSCYPRFTLPSSSYGVLRLILCYFDPVVPVFWVLGGCSLVRIRFRSLLFLTAMGTAS